MAAVALLALSVLVVSFNRPNTADSPAEDATATTRLGPATTRLGPATTQNVSFPADGSGPDSSGPSDSVVVAGGIEGLNLVAVPGSAEPGGLLFIDLESGNVGRRAGRSYSSSDAPAISAGNDDIIVLANPPDESYVIDASGSVSLINTTLDTNLVGALNDRRAWIVQPEPDGVTLVRADITRDGIIPVGDLTTFPDSTVLGDDGNGDVVISGPGGIYVASDDGIERLTTGVLLAISATVAYVRECDEALVCRDEAIDRGTGARATTGLDDAWTIEPMTQRLGLGSLSTISPDGEAALVRSSLFGSPGQWILIDFVQEAAFSVKPPDQETPVIWAEDSRTAAWVAGSTLQTSQRPSAEGGRLATEMTELGPIGNITTDASPPRAVPPCPDETAQACLADTASIGLDFDFGIDGLDLPTIERAETACAQGGDGPPDDPQVEWLLCAVLLDDGRQAVIGRANDPDLVVRTTLKQKTVEFPANTGPGQVVILNEPAPIFTLIDAAGETVGRFADPEPLRTQPE